MSNDPGNPLEDGDLATVAVMQRIARVRDLVNSNAPLCFRCERVIASGNVASGNVCAECDAALTREQQGQASLMAANPSAVAQQVIFGFPVGFPSWW